MLTVEDVMIQRKKLVLNVEVDGRVVPGRIVGTPGRYCRVAFAVNGERDFRAYTWESIRDAVNAGRPILA